MAKSAAEPLVFPSAQTQKQNSSGPVLAPVVDIDVRHIGRKTTQAAATERLVLCLKQIVYYAAYGAGEPGVPRRTKAPLRVGGGMGNHGSETPTRAGVTETIG